MSLWGDLSAKGKVIAGIVGGIAALGTVYAWSSGAVDTLITTEKERQELEQHHDSDIKNVLQLIADEKKSDRIQRNHRELSRLQRDLVGEKYQNEGEKVFMTQEIQRLENELRCDEKGICIN
jgi:gas vesicle protein